MRLQSGLVRERGSYEHIVFKAYSIDTTPGNLLSPFHLQRTGRRVDKAYLDWLRDQFKANPAVKQRLAIVARHKRPRCNDRCHRSLQDTPV
jgi:hypothetical protein